MPEYPHDDRINASAVFLTNRKNAEKPRCARVFVIPYYCQQTITLIGSRRSLNKQIVKITGLEDEK